MSDAELLEQLARVIHPEAFAEDAADIIDDVPVARAYAALYARRVAEWLVEHDRQVAERAYERCGLDTGNALLALIPRNPFRAELETSIVAAASPVPVRLCQDDLYPHDSHQYTDANGASFHCPGYD